MDLYFDMCVCVLFYVVLVFFLEFASLLDCIELDCRACTVNFLSHPALFLSQENVQAQPSS